MAPTNSGSKIGGIVDLWYNQEVTVLRSFICCLHGDWNFAESNWVIRNPWQLQFVQHEGDLTYVTCRLKFNKNVPKCQWQKDLHNSWYGYQETASLKSKKKCGKSI